MRKTVIAGNWKMNQTPSEAAALSAQIAVNSIGAGCEVVICPPFVDLYFAKKAIENSPVKLGAQNCHWAEKGAFTGEVSADMLLEAGCEYVILGHSERRQYFGETDETVNARLKAVLSRDLKAIVCVGESREQREAGETKAIIERQIRRGLADLTAEQMQNVIIAYEPIWAIGTGLVATVDQAQEVCAFIRSLLTQIFGKETADETTVQYGGSMNDKNCADLLAMPDIDGGLIGGASLKPDSFAAIVKAASQQA